MSTVSPFCIRYMKGTWWDQAKYQETGNRKSGNPIPQDKELWSQTTSEVSSITLLTSAPDFLYGHLRVCCLSTSILALGSPPIFTFSKNSVSEPQNHAERRQILIRTEVQPSLRTPSHSHQLIFIFTSRTLIHLPSAPQHLHLHHTSQHTITSHIILCTYVS